MQDHTTDENRIPPEGHQMPPMMAEDPVAGVLTLPGFGPAYAKAIANGPLDNAALWYIDMRGFRSINPKFGFMAGNAVLRLTADCIREALSGDFPIARLGGDRFVFLTTGFTPEKAVEAFDDFALLVNSRLHEAGVNALAKYIGGAYFLRGEDYERDFKRPLDYASIAHRKAQLNPNISFELFNDEDLQRDLRRIVIEQSIDAALASGQIEVWYQPQVDYVYGEIIGAEALARWHHPELGWVSPEEFVPVLEECGKVHDLDLYIWEEACRSAGRWRTMADGKPVPISVNVSRAEILDPGLLEHFKELQRKYGLPDGSLHLEVTESAFVESLDHLNGVISNMRANDMVVEMDDFGSGLSSLNMLKDVPVDVVKLDMGFVRNGVNEKRGGVVLGSIIRMLQGLDTPIIAEGVETLEQAEMLKNMGCRLMQGFHFSRPMPLEDFESFIASNVTVDDARRREPRDSKLEALMGFTDESSFLFNSVIGGTIFFFIRGYETESILVNDQFYKECGLKRSDFGSRKIDPIMEIDEESRATLWRAAAEARESGSAMCTAKVRLTGRWFEGVIRFIGENQRGDIYSLNICRSGELADLDREIAQITQDFSWDVEMLDKIVPNGFVKCKVDDELDIDYISPKFVEASGHAEDVFVRRFHNSFAEMLAASDRANLRERVRESAETGGSIMCEVRLHRGMGGLQRAHILGRVGTDSAGKRWVYMAVMLGAIVVETSERDEEDVLIERVVPFDYFMDTDKLVIHALNPDGSPYDIVIEGWLTQLETLPDNISPASAAKVLATVSDLRHHPLTGFTDLQCNLRGGEELRWYHINYICDSDGEGNTTVVHGFAHDANDEMGSAKWWRRQAEMDQLTGLLNRNAAEQQINLAVRMHGGGVMFMVDLDEFKRVNDDLGHLVGDNLLREVSRVLAAHFREGDVLGRYGGDEFVAFMPLSGDSSNVYEIAERRARDVLEAIDAIENPDGTHAACSVGVAITLTGDASFYDLLEEADHAMYASKEAGKNTFTIRVPSA